jgi:hypothetical protein
MVKRITWISISLFLVAVVIYIVLYFQGYKQYSSLNYLKAIPSNTTFIVITNNLPETISHVEKSDSLVTNLAWIKPIADLQQLLKNIKTSKWAEKHHLEVLNGPVAIALELDKPDIGYTFFYGFYDVQTERKFTKQLKSNTGLFKRIDKENHIYQLSLEELSSPLFAAISDGVLIIGTTSNQVGASLKQLGNSYSLLNDAGFMEAQKTVSKEAALNLFVNLPQIDSLAKITQQSKTRIPNLSEWGEWAALDLNITTSTVNITGIITPAESSKRKAYALLNSIPPSPSQLIGSLPVQTVLAKAYNFGTDAQLVKRSLKTYLNENGPATINDSVLGIIQSEIAIAYVSFDSITDKFLVFETSSYSQSLEKLSAILSQDENTEIKPIAYFAPSANAQVPIYRAFENREMATAVQFLFRDSPDKYFAIFGSQIIFADSVAPLNRYLHQKALDRTLGNAPIFATYIKNYPSDSHLHLFVSPTFLSTSSIPFLSEKNINRLEQAIPKLATFYGCGLQLSFSGNTLFLSQNLLFAPNREQEPVTVWQSKLDSSVVMKPLMVYNPKSQEKEFLVQDLSNRIYLIGAKGVVLWSKRIDAPINGDIQTIDFYGNKKTQFAFSAGDAIYVIDYNGNNVGKFPVRLPSKATNPLSVFDYDQNGNYRFVVACEDKSIMVYNTEANRLPDWTFASTETTVTYPVQHIFADGKDFIVVTDQNRYYFLDRKGKERLDPSSLPPPIGAFTSAKPTTNTLTILTLTQKGELLKLALPSGRAQKSPTEWIPSGKTFLKVIEGSSQHILCKDEKGIALMDEDGGVIWSKNFTEGIMGNPDIYNFGREGRKIGLSTKAGKIFLFNLDGSVYPGFPLVGISRFSIGYASPENNNFNLVVGGKNHYFYNYEINSGKN